MYLSTCLSVYLSIYEAWIPAACTWIHMQDMQKDPFPKNSQLLERTVQVIAGLTNYSVTFSMIRAKEMIYNIIQAPFSREKDHDSLQCVSSFHPWFHRVLATACIHVQAQWGHHVTHLRSYESLTSRTIRERNPSKGGRMEELLIKYIS